MSLKNWCDNAWLVNDPLNWLAKKADSLRSQFVTLESLKRVRSRRRNEKLEVTICDLNRERELEVPIWNLKLRPENQIIS